MKTIRLADLEQDDALFQPICRCLDDGKLVCFPGRGAYRIAADLTSKAAVGRLLQSKRRTGKAPALVFIADRAMLAQVADEVPPLAERLARAFWPGSLTILFRAHPGLPGKVVKPLLKANGRLGVRIPADPVARRISTEFGRPLLISSANVARKQGSSSPAQVRKNFMGRVDLFVDGGDLPDGGSSTVVRVEDGAYTVTREGRIPEAEIARRVAAG